MAVKFTLLLVVLPIGLSMPPARAGQTGSDWVPTRFDAVQKARASETTFRSFLNGAGHATFNEVCPFPPDPTGKGVGHFNLNCYFWLPKRFQIEYLVEGTRKPAKNVPGDVYEPTPEYLISTGIGAMSRRGSEVGSQSKFDPKSFVFNVSSDALLVEAWPTHFTKYLYSTFAQGNATLSRYVQALVKGVGNYTIETYRRSVRINMKQVVQLRIHASRLAVLKKPASSIDIVFQEVKQGVAYLPIRIETTYGPIYHLEWMCGWSNHLPADQLPTNPNQIGSLGTVTKQGKPGTKPRPGKG